jgi:hypothetical protein
MKIAGQMNFGIELTGDDKAVVDYRINQLLNPDNLPPIELGQKRYLLTQKQKVTTTILASKDDGFYINRTRGDRFDKIYYATKQELLKLIEEHIDADEFSGLDLLVANEDFTWVFVTSHDGDIYTMR